MASAKKIKWISITIGILLVFGIYGMIVSSRTLSEELRNAVPRQYAIKTAKSHSAVIQSLGKQIAVKKEEPENKNEGEFSLSLSFDGFDFEQKSINTTINLEGEKGKGTLVVIGKKVGSDWIYDKLYVVVASTGEKIDLL